MNGLLKDCALRFPTFSSQYFNFSVELNKKPRKLMGFMYLERPHELATKEIPEGRARHWHIRRIVNDREAEGEHMTIVNVQRSASDGNDPHTTFFVADIDKTHSPESLYGNEATDRIQRPSCVDVFGRPLEATYDEVDEIVRRVRLEARLSSRPPWSTDLIHDVLKQYINDRGDSRKVTLYY